MDELLGAMQMVFADGQKASQPTGLQIGTVESVSPLQITIENSMQVLRPEVLYLTSAVIERKIPVLTHRHLLPDLEHDHGGEVGKDLGGEKYTEYSLQSEGSSGAVQAQDIVARERGELLPIENGYIILNRALKIGDKVLLLRVENGQKFIILSRVFPVN